MRKAVPFGWLGVQLRVIPASLGVRPALWRLQDMQALTTFSQVC